MRIDRRAFQATLGTAAAIGAMPSETLADALEHHMMETLDEQTTTNELKIRRGAGFLFGGPSPSGRPLPANGNLELMPEKPTLADFFKYRFAPATHVLQSATHATKGGENEETILACPPPRRRSEHDQGRPRLVGRADTDALRFGEGSLGHSLPPGPALLSGPSVGYEYPEMYTRIYGKDYVPPRTSRRRTTRPATTSGTWRRA